MKTGMKLLGVLVLSTFMGLAQSQDMNQPLSFMGTGGGNGGFIDEMRSASKLDNHYLTVEEIRELITLDGKEIKNEILLYLIDQMNNTDIIQDARVFEMWQSMKSTGGDISDNVRYTRIEEGSCEEGEHLCTGDKPYSTIVVDVDLVASRFVTIAEFSGMLMHEFTHHYLGEADHPEYVFANWVKKKVSEFKPNQRLFNISEITMVNRGINYAGYTKIMYFGLRDEASEMSYILDGNLITKEVSNADLFCMTKGYLKSKAYTTLDSETFKRVLDNLHLQHSGGNKLSGIYSIEIKGVGEFVQVKKKNTIFKSLTRGNFINSIECE